jgi:hypothetical protein
LRWRVGVGYPNPAPLHPKSENPPAGSGQRGVLIDEALASGGVGPPGEKVRRVVEVVGNAMGKRGDLPGRPSRSRMWGGGMSRLLVQFTACYA